MILPSDHLIKDGQKFINIIENATSSAIEGNIVTFGIVPDSPETGFGYIEAEEKKNLDIILDCLFVNL